MSTYTSEPGTRLAGRYRLVDQVTSGTGWTYWKATDETLARSVTVLTFATGFPRVFYLNYHGYPKFFPLWALARYRNLKTGNSRRVEYGL